MDVYKINQPYFPIKTHKKLHIRCVIGWLLHVCNFRKHHCCVALLEESEIHEIGNCHGKVKAGKYPNVYTTLMSYNSQTFAVYYACHTPHFI
jgi:hypothetical protein